MSRPRALRYNTDPREDAAHALRFYRQNRLYDESAYDVLSQARDHLAGRACERLLDQTDRRERTADARVLAAASKLLNDRVSRLLDGRERWSRRWRPATCPECDSPNHTDGDCRRHFS
jgi:hypothetical protein